MAVGGAGRPAPRRRLPGAGAGDQPAQRARPGRPGRVARPVAGQPPAPRAPAGHPWPARHPWRTGDAGAVPTGGGGGAPAHPFGGGAAPRAATLAPVTPPWAGGAGAPPRPAERPVTPPWASAGAPAAPAPPDDFVSPPWSGTSAPTPPPTPTRADWAEADAPAPRPSHSVEELIQVAIASIRAGWRDEARQSLLEAVERDEQNETAWYWLSTVVDDEDDQQIALENVLAINPENIQAYDALEHLQARRAARPPAPPPSPPPAPVPAPAAEIAPRPPAAPQSAPPPARTGGARRAAAIRRYTGARAARSSGRRADDAPCRERRRAAAVCRHPARPADDDPANRRDRRAPPGYRGRRGDPPPPEPVPVPPAESGGSAGPTGRLRRPNFEEEPAEAASSPRGDAARGESRGPQTPASNRVPVGYEDLIGQVVGGRYRVISLFSQGTSTLLLATDTRRGNLMLLRPETTEATLSRRGSGKPTFTRNGINFYTSNISIGGLNLRNFVGTVGTLPGPQITDYGLRLCTEARKRGGLLKLRYWSPDVVKIDDEGRIVVMPEAGASDSKPRPGPFRRPSRARAAPSTSDPMST